MLATRVELVYGRSGVGKTTWWINLARALHARTGLKTRCYIGDGGAETIYASGLVDEGIIEVFQYNVRDQPSSTARACARGAWPQDKAKPEGVLVREMPEVLAKTYGLFVFEGLTAMAAYIMSSKPGGFRDLAAKGIKIGQDTPYLVDNGGEKFAGNPMSHFGVVQGMMQDLIEETRILPGIVVWTAHQREAEDFETKEILIGPEVSGKALTSKIGAAFGNSLHLDKVSKKVNSKDTTSGRDVAHEVKEFRAYTTEHYDPDGISMKKYYANNRCATPGVVPEFLVWSPAKPESGPVEFYALLEKGKLKVPVAVA